MDKRTVDGLFDQALELKIGMDDLMYLYFIYRIDTQYFYRPDERKAYNEALEEKGLIFGGRPTARFIESVPNNDISMSDVASKVVAEMSNVTDTLAKDASEKLIVGKGGLIKNIGKHDENRRTMRDFLKKCNIPTYIVSDNTKYETKSYTKTSVAIFTSLFEDDSVNKKVLAMAVHLYYNQRNLLPVKTSKFFSEGIWEDMYDTLMEEYNKGKEEGVLSYMNKQLNEQSKGDIKSNKFSVNRNQAMVSTVTDEEEDDELDYGEDQLYLN
jgi:hypothetical protein